jgi:hypothetical protein
MTGKSTVSVGLDPPLTEVTSSFAAAAALTVTAS